MLIQTSENAGVEGFMRMLESLDDLAFKVTSESQGVDVDLVIVDTYFDSEFRPRLRGLVWNEALQDFAEPITIMIFDDLVLTYL